tara:strand:- start:21 stop:398 length:378 start_codon:yes stop_codon:yes gene_type:complete
MGTRAIYTFVDINGEDECTVYKHYDGYPRGAADFIENAKSYAWKFPRYEADEFAAAFVAANKSPEGGGVRLVSDPKSYNWCDYHYIIFMDRYYQDLWVEIQEPSGMRWKTIWEGTHTAMREKVAA